MRKRAGSETPEQPLYQVLDEGKASARQAGTLFASDKRYNVSGVQASIDPDEAGDQNALRDAYEGGRAKADAGVGEALAEGTSAQKRKIDASRGKAAKRRKEMLEAEVLLREEHEEFNAWHAALGAVPAINELQAKAEEMREAEFNKAGKKLKNLSDKEVEAVNRLSRGIVNKLLHGPLSHLRKPGSNIDEAALKLESFRGMFDLNE